MQLQNQPCESDKCQLNLDWHTQWFTQNAAS